MNNNFFTLTSPQKAILSMEQFCPNTSINTISGKISIHDKVDFSLLKKAIHIFVKNTGNIRYQLHNVDGEIVQYEKEYEPFTINHIKLNDNNENEVCDNISKKVFPLYDNPLYYFATFQNEDSTGGFFVCVHHIVSDAWSMSLLISSVIHIYSKLIKNEKNILEDIEYTPYYNFIEQEKNYIESSKFEQDETFWDELFDTNIFENSYNQNITSNSQYEASRSEFKLSKKITLKIIEFCKQIKVSPFTFILFVMGIYESRIKQTNTVVLSAPILNRSTKKDKETFGLFVNNMLFKLDIEENCSFLSAISKLTKSQFSYLRHQKYPLQSLISKIKTKFNIKENIYDTSVSYQNARANHCQDNVNYDSKWLFSGASSIPLLMHIYDMDDTNSFSFIYDYQNKIYNYSQIKDIHNRLLYICEQIMENPNILIKDIELATQEEKNKILNEFNQTNTSYDTTKTILDLLKSQININGNKTAIICGEQKISYKELDLLSNKFAALLQNKYNITKGQNLSIIMNRSIDLIIVTLAVLKCGCAYVLIDPSHPIERRKYMIENSDSKYIISNLSTDEKNTIYFNNIYDLEVNEKYKKPTISSNTPMYLLYTSGSTGNPKAVTVTHRNFHNYLIGISKIIDYSSDKTVLSMASISFDVFGYELWVTLLNGLTLVLSTQEEQNDFVKLNNLIYNNNVNILYGTPSKIQSLMSVSNVKDNFSSVCDIGIGGESFSISFIKELQQITSANIYNMYGPTETTVGCCSKKIEKNTKLITIGKPLANVKFYVLDNNLKLCPPGIKGELYISGDGVTLGYYKRPDLTQKSFIQDIFYPNLTMYKSGDMVSWTDQGELIFHSRTDSQVKIRGYRIELSEIERVLNSHQFIKNCFVMNYNYSDRDFLCAYYTSDFTIQNYELKLFLANKLPNYMIPTYFMPITSLPLTVNGKIDKTKLPSPFDTSKSDKYVKPENELQKNICKALEECLSIKNLSINEDFSNLGIDSLTIIKVQSQLSTHGITIPTQYFYDYSNVKDLCFALEHTNNTEDSTFTNTQYPFLQHDISKIKPRNHRFKNILLTGSTGFLGIHILENLLDKNCNLYCLVRSANEESAKKRILSMFEFYFKDKYSKEFLFKKINVVVGDIKYKNLGLSEDDFDTLGNKIDLVIHSAALVKHLGKYEEFKKMNLDGTKHIADFCIKYNIKLNHISTTSVSGDFMPLNNISDDVDFTENDFFIGQNYNDNYYIKSKLLTEEYLLEQVKQGLLQVNIFRVGNLTGRYSDGIFQYNIDSNAFYNKLQFILKNKIFYESGTLQEFDMSPVDEVADAITNIIYNYGIQNKIFHIMNPKKFTINTLAEKLNDLGNNIKILKDSDFYKKIMKMDLDTNSLMISDYNLHTNISYLNIKTKCNITLEYLNKIGFKYKKINLNYLTKIIDYMKYIKFI